MIKRVLIANRGEAAIRIIRAVKELGMLAVAVYSTNDKDSLHVSYADEAYCIGPQTLKDSYLNKKAIISVAINKDCQAIHPGYGFLAEDYEFSKIVEDEGLIFIGPSSSSIKIIGNKIRAKKLLEQNGISVIKGYIGPVKDLDHALSLAEEITYPIIIKTSNGGGGRGIRICHSKSELRKAFDLASIESSKLYEADDLYIEKYISNARHIESQVLADKFGNILVLPERNCSIQRKNQKILEETPASISSKVRNQIIKTSKKIVSISNYTNAGTIEFLLDDYDNLYFMEMNTRLQVEHTITEMITGIDIVKMQILLADNKKLSINQQEIRSLGHSIEARINAEDPYNNFITDFGRIEGIKFPSGFGVRVESHLMEGQEITPFYDSMLAKIIVKSDTRDAAINKLKQSLKELKIEGVKTNITFIQSLLNQKEFLDNTIHTNFIDTKQDDLLNP